MGHVKILIIDADGRRRGGLHRDRVLDPNRWKGTEGASREEVMVCEGDLERGDWRLIDYVYPREIVGDEKSDSLFDERSRCRLQTLPQALGWFCGQSIGPPPALVDRTRKFAADWAKFRDSAQAIAILQQLVAVRLPDDAHAFEVQDSAIRDLLIGLDLVLRSSASYLAASLVMEMGVLPFIAWMDRHLDAVADITKAQLFESRPTAMDSLAPGSPKDWLSLMGHVERAYDLLGHYLRALQPSASLPKREIDSANWQIEVVLRRWLPLAFQAEDQLIKRAHGLIGMREQAVHFLDQADLGAGRSSCLRSLADKAYSETKNTEDSLAACRQHLQHWREMLPAEWIAGTGTIQLSSWDRLRMSASTFYWSSDVTKRQSLRGASYLLAVGCDALANEAVRIGLPSERARPALRLAIRLREHPEFPHVDDQVLHAVIHEQIVLAREVEEMLAEVELSRRAKPAKLTAAQGRGYQPDLPEGESANATTPTSVPPTRPRRVQRNIDDAGHEHLCIAWDGQDPDHRRRPTWRKLAESVHKALGLNTKISSTLQALKTRAQRTREKWDAIGLEMAREKAERGALRRR